MRLADLEIDIFFIVPFLLAVALRV